MSSTHSVGQRPPHPVEVGSTRAWTWFVLAHAISLIGLSLVIVGAAFVGSQHWFWCFLPFMAAGLLLGAKVRPWASERAWAEVPGAFGLLRRGEKPWSTHPAEWIALSVRGVILAVMCAVIARASGPDETTIVTGLCAYMGLSMLISSLLAGRWRKPMAMLAWVGTWGLSWLASFTAGRHAWNITATCIGLVMGIVLGAGIGLWARHTGDKI